MLYDVITRHQEEGPLAALLLVWTGGFPEVFDPSTQNACTHRPAALAQAGWVCNTPLTLENTPLAAPVPEIYSQNRFHGLGEWPIQPSQGVNPFSFHPMASCSKSC